MYGKCRAHPDWTIGVSDTSYIGGQAPRTVINECPICMTNYVTKMLDNAVTSSNTSVGLSAFCTS
jgi:hypothetical protein